MKNVKESQGLVLTLSAIVIFIGAGILRQSIAKEVRGVGTTYAIAPK